MRTNIEPLLLLASVPSAVDWYGEDYYKQSPGADPKGPATGFGRVLRGGSWGRDPGLCHSAGRDWQGQAGTSGGIGFRVVCAAQ